MIFIAVDPTRNLLSFSYRGRVTAAEVQESRASALGHFADLKPGFCLLTDLTFLESMETACAVGLGALMEEFAKQGVRTIVRVIPDPAKDIGFALLSLFHYQKPIPTRTYENLEDALKSLPGHSGI